MRIIRLILMLALCGWASGAMTAYAASEIDLVLEECQVMVKDEVRIPAPESGVLTQLVVQEGSRVAEGNVLGVIDDRKAQAALKIAQYGMDAALARARDKVEEKYALKASEVAQVDWEKALAANARKKDAVPEIEVMQKKLSYERARLQIEKAQKDRELAKLDWRTKKAEHEAAQMAVDWRTIKAPFDGEVVTTYRHEKEWVNPGDPILLLVRFDKLYVEGFVDAKQHDRGDVLGKKVTIQLARARGNRFSVTGTVVYVDQQMQSNAQFRIRAEVQNKLVDNHWLVQPGMIGTMTVQLAGSAQVPQAGLPTPLGN
ncbi:MAG: HlyD family efflux transporter periplasmic adaptor subunit [Pirellulales bacterium]|nr:HlyD family efflux transporter periplasmic adaptor subunit [Pirellulales bacterium]